ncbi:MAG: DUF551 domain-containing protein [Clostridium sp.]|nr:DUF551 domain-containing protein [Clostridium sp.]
MTINEAIKILDPETSREALQPYAYDNHQRRKVVDEACRVVVAELGKRQWINVEDRLPDKELQEAISQSRNFVDFEGTPQIEVLVMVAWAKRPTILWYDGAEFYDDDFNNYRVNYWMPLPEPRIKGTACQ